MTIIEVDGDYLVVDENFENVIMMTYMSFSLTQSSSLIAAQHLQN